MQPIQLTSEQRAICDCPHPRIVVEANAGAGKTTTAVLKMARLAEQGCNPSKILALSFTRPGVQAYRDAFRRLGVADPVAGGVRVGTFEDFCAARLKRLDGIDVPRLDKPEEVRSFVLSAIAKARTWAEARYPGEFAIAGTGELAVEGLLADFAHIKGTLQLERESDRFRLSPSGADELGRDFTTLAILRAYESERSSFLDAEGGRARFRYSGDATYDLARSLDADEPPFTWESHPLRLDLEAIVLDEMHDTNWAMFTVLRELLKVNERVRFVGVGDRDQVIHAHEGASPYFMGEGFDRVIGAATRFPLGRSYRFGPAIARPLAAFSGKAYPSDPGCASRVEIRPANSATDLLAILNEAVGNRSGLRAGSGLDQVAVLLRHPSEAAELEHELRRTGLRYEAVGFTTYLQRPEVLFCRMLLMAAVGSKESLSGEVLAGAKRATWAFVGGTLRTANDAQDPTAGYVDSMPQANFIERALPRFLETSGDAGTRDQVREAMRLAASDRIGALASSVAALDVKRMARRVFVNRQAADDAQASIHSLVRAARQYGSISAFLKSLVVHDYEAHAARLAKGRIVLSSIDAAKGLEFDHVIVPDVNRAGFEGGGADDRNLFYVAASRARQLLTLTHHPGQASAYLRPYAAGA